MNIIKTNDIVYEWLCVSANRKRLPILQASKDVLDFLKANSTVWSFPWNDGITEEEDVYQVDDNYFRILLKED